MSSDPARQRKMVERYSRTNPPPSEEIALAAIDKCSTDIANIEAKLDHQDASTFPNKNSYQAWRTRATSALAHTRQELNFLEKWVQGRQLAVQQFKRQIPGSGSIYSDLRQVAQSIRNRARELADEIGDSYTPHYSTTIQPDSLSVAQERMSYLTGMKQQLEAAFSEVSAAWTEHPLRRDDLTGVKAPLQKILSQVEMEMSIIKKYTRAQSTQNPINPQWKSVCVGALERAASEGFALTEVEQTVLRELKSNIMSG